MKKLIMLGMVLGLASMACAFPTLSGSFAPDGTATITVTVGEDPLGIILIWTDDYAVYSGRLISVGAINPDAGDGEFTFAEADSNYPNDLVRFGYNDEPGRDTTYGGDLFSFVISGAGLNPGDVLSLTILDSSFNTLGTVEIWFPEPMTLSLLGLGGLLIRRRK